VIRSFLPFSFLEKKKEAKKKAGGRDAPEIRKRWRSVAGASKLAPAGLKQVAAFPVPSLAFANLWSYPRTKPNPGRDRPNPGKI